MKKTNKENHDGEQVGLSSHIFNRDDGQMNNRKLPDASKCLLNDEYQKVIILQLKLQEYNFQLQGKFTELAEFIENELKRRILIIDEKKNRTIEEQENTIKALKEQLERRPNETER